MPAGVKVVLRGNGWEIPVETDEFGEYRFDYIGNEVAFLDAVIPSNRPDLYLPTTHLPVRTRVDGSLIVNIAFYPKGVTPGSLIQIDMTSSATEVAQDENVSFTITVTNHWYKGVNQVVVADYLPEGLTYVHATSSQGQVTWDRGLVWAPLGYLAAGRSATVTILATVNHDVRRGTTILNRATAYHGENVAVQREVPVKVVGAANDVPGWEPGPATMGNLLKGIAVDKARNLVYVAVQSNHTIAIVDGATHEVVGAVSCGGIAPNGLALSEDGSKLFVVNGGSNQVAVLDINNGYALARTIGVGNKPFGIAIANRVAYVTNFGDGTVTLIDVNSMTAFNTLWVGHHPALPAATGNRAYIPVHSGYGRWQSKDPEAEWEYVQQNKGRDTGVALVYSDGRPAPVGRVLQDYVGFFAAAVDEVHGRVYITKRDGTAEGLYVLNSANNALLKFIPLLRPYAVAVNPLTNHVFVVQGDMDEVYVFDASNDYRMIRALNTGPNNGDMPGMHGGQGIGVNDNDVYVANYASGILTIVNDADLSGNFAVPMDGNYIRGWMESGGNHGPLGDPAAPSYGYWYSEQQYERGSMHLRQAATGPNRIYVFDIESAQTGGTVWFGRQDGVWQLYNDGWTLGMPLFPAGCPQAGWPYGPMFGFGVTWCNNPDVRNTIGMPIGWEYGVIGGDQPFANGVVLWNPASDAYYVLRNDTRRWQYYRAHRRYSVDEIEPNVTGQVRLQGGSDPSGVILTSPAGLRVATDENGDFEFSYEGQVTLHVSHPGHLDAVATVKAVPNVHLDMGEIELLGGDVNGDNQIDILDISYIGYRFSSADARADVNGDGIVDILDLSLVGANFGRAGPVHWEG
jgi:uncharacterized repeat protein (TIGR01451 family)